MFDRLLHFRVDCLLGLWRDVLWFKDDKNDTLTKIEGAAIFKINKRVTKISISF